MHGIATPLRVPTPARMVHQDSTDNLRTQGEKLRAAFTFDPAGAKQLEVRFVSDRRGFQGVVAGCPAKMVPSDAPQLGIDRRNQLIECLFVPVAPSAQ